MATDDPLEGVTYEALTQVHPDCEGWADTWEDFRLLYKGGDEFLRAAGQLGRGRGVLAGLGGTTSMKHRRFLHQMEGEPNDTYLMRLDRAHYIGYIGAIVDYFGHWLFSQPPVIRPNESEDPPDWYETFNRDCTGNAVSFLDFVKDVYRKDVLVLQRAGWLIGHPTEGIGDEVSLTSYSAEEIRNWQKDDSGKLEWVLLSKCKTVQDFPAPRLRVETFTYVDRDRWMAWELNSKDKSVTLVGEGVHGLESVPFVWLEIPDGLWPVNKLASWQMNLFNKTSMLSNAELQSCYLQPYLKTREIGDSAPGRIFGEGYLLMLRAGSNGTEGEDFGWKSANIEPLKFLTEALKEERDEGYRAVHQMSLAVDSQAVGAVARSGASKIEDRRATEIILCGMGAYPRNAMIETLNKVSEIMGDDTEWVVDGFDNFQVSSLDDEMQTAAILSTLNIDSPTFKKETQTDFATGRILGKKDDSIKEKIKQEIADSIDAQEEAKLMGPPQVGPDGKPLQPGASPQAGPLKDQQPDKAPPTPPADNYFKG